MIDPWGVAGQGQVYSEKYVIRNCGTQAGILYLSDIVCHPGEGSDVVIVRDESMILADEEKKIYLMMQMENGEALVLSQEENQYCMEMAPGSEIVFWLTGKINSNVAYKWEDNDVLINMKYRFEASVH